MRIDVRERESLPHEAAGAQIAEVAKLHPLLVKPTIANQDAVHALERVIVVVVDPQAMAAALQAVEGEEVRFWRRVSLGHVAILAENSPDCTPVSRLRRYGAPCACEDFHG